MRPRGILIAGNWKMNLGPAETTAFFKKLGALWNEKLSDSTRRCVACHTLEVAVFPPAVSMYAALQSGRDLGVHVGSQNTHYEKSGAFTGEVSGPMLTELGIQWSLVGHSERRQFFGETDETVCKRASSLLGQGFRVILCVGETREERESGRTQAVLTRQLAAALNSTVAQYMDGRLTIAYEPVWAIGTGLNATPEQAEEAHQIIRRHVWDHQGIEASGRTRILYGGSVKPDNLAEILRGPNVDGALVGGASVKPESFLELIEIGGKNAL